MPSVWGELVFSCYDFPACDCLAFPCYVGLNLVLKIEPVKLRLHSTLWKHTNNLWYLVIYCNHTVVKMLPGSLSPQCHRREDAVGPCFLCGSSGVEYVFPAGAHAHTRTCTNGQTHRPAQREVSVFVSAHINTRSIHRDKNITESPIPFLLPK